MSLTSLLHPFPDLASPRGYSLLEVYNLAANFLSGLFRFVAIIKDLGHGEFDDSRQVLKLEQPSINTTRHLVSEMGRHDLVLHVGDLSYADGYEPIVRKDIPYFFEEIGTSNNY